MIWLFNFAYDAEVDLMIVHGSNTTIMIIVSYDSVLIDALYISEDLEGFLKVLPLLFLVYFYLDGL
jgi:hypothetical protein